MVKVYVIVTKGINGVVVLNTYHGDHIIIGSEKDSKETIKKWVAEKAIPRCLDDDTEKYMSDDILKYATDYIAADVIITISSLTCGSSDNRIYTFV